MRHKNKEKYPELFSIVTFLVIPTMVHGKLEYPVIVLCRDKDGNPFQFNYEELGKYE